MTLTKVEKNIANNHSRYPNHRHYIASFWYIYSAILFDSSFSTSNSSTTLSTENQTLHVVKTKKTFECCFYRRYVATNLILSALGYFGLDLVHAGWLRQRAKVA